MRTSAFSECAMCTRAQRDVSTYARKLVCGCNEMHTAGLSIMHTCTISHRDSETKRQTCARVARSKRTPIARQAGVHAVVHLCAHADVCRCLK